MNKLILNLSTSNIESVTNSVISALYSSVINEPVSLNIDMSGSLLTEHAYQEDVTYLTNRFQNLTINVTGGYYIKFQNEGVKNWMLNNSRCNPNKSEGITTTEAAVMTLGQWGLGNGSFSYITESEPFPELAMFTQIKTLYGEKGRILYNSNIEEIDFSNIESVVGNFHALNIKRTTGSLDGVVVFPKLKSFSNSTNNLSSCPYIREIYFQSNFITPIGRGDGIVTYGTNFSSNVLEKVVFQKLSAGRFGTSFIDCPSLTTVEGDFSDVTVMNSCFRNCPNLTNFVIYLPNLSESGDLLKDSFCSGTLSNASWVSIYLPNLTEVKGIINQGGFVYSYLGGTVSNGAGVNYRNVLYFKNVLTIHAASLCRTSIKALVINNTTPPTFEVAQINYSFRLNRNNNQTTLPVEMDPFGNYVETSTGNTGTVNRYMRDDSDFYYGVLWNTTLTAVYVPDSAVATYQAATGWSDLADKIHSMNELTVYPTRTDWVTAGCPDVCLIAEYMS